MASQVCPVRGCGKLYDGKEDHPFDPCVECWKQGWRTDSAHNVYRLRPRPGEGTDCQRGEYHCTYPECAC